LTHPFRCDIVQVFEHREEAVSPVSRTGEVAHAVTPDPAAPAATDLDAELRLLAQAVHAVTSLPVDALDVALAARAHDDLRALSDRLRAYGARLLAQVEADGRWAASGSARAFPEWVARRGSTSVGSARREAALGRALRHDLPLAREAVTEGRMSLEHAQVLAQLAPTSDARRAALAGDATDRNEASLVTTATQVGVDDYRRLVRQWAAAVDTTAHETEHDTAHAREYLHLSRRPDGMQIQGFLAGEHAETLTTALRAIAGVPAADDPRSPEQRRAAALTDLARVVLDRGLGGAGAALVRPHISVHVPWDTFTRLTQDTDTDAPVTLEGPDGALGAAAELDDGTPIPLTTLAQLACDAEITRIVFGPHSAPLDIGRTQRTYTGPQRRAVIARDRHCQYPGCGAPPTLGEIHHIREWIRDNGPTSVTNGILLCWHHHHTIHRRLITITRGPGGWKFHDRDGQPITPRDRQTPPPADVPFGRRSSAPAESPPLAEPHTTGAAHTTAEQRATGDALTAVVQDQLALTG
jgi:hypothetical protein